jgi:cytoskeletal protein RodZ
MKTVGLVLREARENKGYTLIQVEKDTRIRLKFLDAIERDDYSKLPSVAYAKGFVKNYSDYLGLNSDTVLAFFRRQTKEVSRSSLLPSATEEHLRKSLIRLTPARFLGLLLVGLVFIFLTYLGLQYRKISQPPTLAIDSPKQGMVFHERRTDILGRTDSDATLMVNGVSVLVRSDGRFFDQVTLEEGKNSITITATSRYGKISTQTRDVSYKQQ